MIGDKCLFVRCMDVETTHTMLKRPSTIRISIIRTLHNSNEFSVRVRVTESIVYNLFLIFRFAEINDIEDELKEIDIDLANELKAF